MIIDGWVNLVTVPKDGAAGIAQLSRMFNLPEGRLASSASDLVAAMVDARVDHAVLAANLNPPALDRTGVRMLDIDAGLAACRDSGGRLSAMGVVGDPHDVMGLCRALRKAAEHPEFRCVGVVPFALERYMTDPCLYPVYATCVDLGLPVVINSGICGPLAQSKYQDPMMLEDILVHFPELTVIVGHGGHPYERVIIRLMAKFRGLHVMTSAWMPKYLDPVLVEFMGSRRGAGRVIFGSDWPLIDPATALAQARELPLCEDARDGYLGDNLRALLGL